MSPSRSRAATVEPARAPAFTPSHRQSPRRTPTAARPSIAGLPPLPPNPREVPQEDRARIVRRLRVEAQRGRARDPDDELEHRRLRSEVTRELRSRTDEARRAAFDHALAVIVRARAAVIEVAAEISVEDLRHHLRLFLELNPDAPEEERSAARLLVKHAPSPRRNRALSAVADALVPRVSLPPSRIGEPNIAIDSAARERPRRAPPPTARTTAMVAGLLLRKHAIEERTIEICADRFGYSYDEVCAALGITADALKARRRRALARSGS